MAINTLADLRAHLSFTADLGVVDDGMLSRLNSAAQSFAERKLGFAIEATFGGAGQAAMPDDLRQAVLMLAGHWYDNREAAGEAAREPPFGVSEILREYRNWQV